MINGSDLPKASTQPRSKNESREDKRARKQAIKEERKVRLVFHLFPAWQRESYRKLLFIKVVYVSIKVRNNISILLNRNEEWRRKLTS